MAAEIIKTIQLEDPLDQGDGKPPLTELSFRKPSAADFWNFPIDGSKLGDVLEVAGKCCGMVGTEMKRLSARDMVKVADFFGSLLPAGPATGKS